MAEHAGVIDFERQLLLAQARGVIEQALKDGRLGEPPPYLTETGHRRRIKDKLLALARKGAQQK